jgi:N-glycosidase YbiA
MTDIITSFRGEHAYLSNFFYCLYPFHFRYSDNPFVAEEMLLKPGEEIVIWVKSAEHIFQALKATNKKGFQYVLDAGSPVAAKRRGHAIKCRPDWTEGVDIRSMLKAVKEKFAYNAALRLKLIKTGPALLIEGNTWNDRTWGQVLINGKWEGENRLGKILQMVRWYFMKQTDINKTMEEYLQKIIKGE